MQFEAHPTSGSRDKPFLLAFADRVEMRMNALGYWIHTNIVVSAAATRPDLSLHADPTAITWPHDLPSPRLGVR